MKPLAALTVLACVIGSINTTPPPFDIQAALFVGAIVTVVVAVVIIAAIATPFVAIQAGATMIGTATAVAVVALVTGVIGGTAAGVFWGNQGNIEHSKHLERIAAQSNHLHITFNPSKSDPRRAADFECNIIVFRELELNSRPPRIKEETLQIQSESASEFYSLVGQQLEQWFATSVLADDTSTPRCITVYMMPTPGEGVYDRLRSLALEKGTREVAVQRVDGTWKSSGSEMSDD